MDGSAHSQVAAVMGLLGLGLGAGIGVMIPSSTVVFEARDRTVVKLSPRIGPETLGLARSVGF